MIERRFTEGPFLIAGHEVTVIGTLAVVSALGFAFLEKTPRALLVEGPDGVWTFLLDEAQPPGSLRPVLSRLCG